MKKRIHHKFITVLLFACLLAAAGARAQGDSAAADKPEPVVPEEVITLKYYSANNHMQYLVLESRLKTGKKYAPLPGKTFQVYMDSIDAAMLVGKLTTNAEGQARAFIPPGLKAAWDAAGAHTFMAVPAGKEEAAAELTMVKAKIEMGTAGEAGSRTITVKLMKMDGTEWKPVPDVEMKVGVLRLGGILPGGEDVSCTTDSSGSATVTFIRDSIPGDAKGNITLAAKVEDHEELGNLLLEQAAPWGKPVAAGKNFFDQRTLWSTRFKTPFWLLFMAYGIVIGVWGTLIYLIAQLFKIKKLGRQAETAS